MSNIYVLNLAITKNNWECQFLDSIVDNGIFYTLEEAITYGKYSFLNMACNSYDKDNITESELNEYIQDNNIEYNFTISIIANNRKRFNTCNELIDYFDSNIKSISNDNLFDFLLSLVESYNITYDYHGNIIAEEPIPQYPKDSIVVSAIVDFTINSCKNNQYRFEYFPL